MRSADTSPQAHAVQQRALRNLTPAQRLEAALRMSDEVMAVTMDGIRHRSPELTEAEVVAELHRILGHPVPQ